MADLSDRLRELGRQIDVRPPDDLADRVMSGIDAAPGAARSRRPGWTRHLGWSRHLGWWRRPGWSRWLGWWRPAAPRWRLVAVAAGVAVLLAGGVVAVSPPVRAAIAHIFGGVSIHTGPSTGPTPTPVPNPTLPDEHRTDLAGAARELGFPVRLPSGLGPPTTVSVADGRVARVQWQRPDGLIGLDEFRGDLGPMWDKFAQFAAQPVAVDGHPGLWFAGKVVVEYIDRDGNPIPSSSRQTRNTLIWTDGPLSFRLDGVASRAEAVALADTVR